jgi:ADP-dependent NAD(P)H-hydrate dehydratase / NAD(P)H-hydrate epimerase
MQTFLTSAQTRNADQYTICNTPVSSLDLMESASKAFVQEFKKHVQNKDETISIYCGTGNNGGDGLAVARLLKGEGYSRLSVKIARFLKRSTPGFNANFERLKLSGIGIIEISHSNSLPDEDASILIDALLGLGLNKPLDGDLKNLVKHLNNLQRTVFSIDAPTGFFCEGLIDPSAIVFKATTAIVFQRPKLNFFFPESAYALENFKVVNIGLDEEFIQAQQSGWKLIEEEDTRHILKLRKEFSHKGTYGHALIIAGSPETMGAALLCTDACLHSGAGLTTACIPEGGLIALNTRSPEAMALIRTDQHKIIADKYSSIGFGPGLGNNKNTLNLLKKVLDKPNIPLVIDADGLNILAAYPKLLPKLPVYTILTPHMKEFDRLFGEHQTWWERVETAKEKAKQYQIIILLKNRYSFIILPSGDVLINPSGNPAMAVGGMGDVLTGMITSFLAQGYVPEQASIIACYLHGKAGDVLKAKGMFSIPPRYIIQLLPHIIRK